MSNLKQHKQSLFCRDEQSIKDYENAMNKAVQAVSNWLKNDKMYTGGSIKQMRALIDGFKPSQAGVGVENALDHLVEIFLNPSLKVHHPHSLAHLHCPTMVTSQIAEVLINATNQSMDSWDQSPAGSIMEEHLIDWLRQKVGYGQGTSGVFTSGGTQSNLMGVLLARDWAIANHWKNEDGSEWSVQRDGIPVDAMKKVKVICSENAHFSVQKNMAMNTVMEDSPVKIGNWSPKNYDGVFRDSMTLAKALEISNNIIPVKLLQRVGINSAEKVWRDAGVVGGDFPKNYTLALGSISTRPIDMAMFYAALANGGYQVEPQYIYKVENKYGEVIYEAKPKMKKVYDSKDVAILTYMLENAVNYGTGQPAKVFKDGKLIPMAGKTGTTQVKRITREERLRGVTRQEDLPWRHRNHALFVGYAPYKNPRFAVSVVVEHGISGSTAAAPIARDLMKKTLELYL